MAPCPAFVALGTLPSHVGAFGKNGFLDKRPTGRRIGGFPDAAGRGLAAGCVAGAQAQRSVTQTQPCALAKPPQDEELYFDGLSYPPHVLEWCRTDVGSALTAAAADEVEEIASGEPVAVAEEAAKGRLSRDPHQDLGAPSINGSSSVNRDAQLYGATLDEPLVESNGCSDMDPCTVLSVDARRVDKAFVSTFRMSSPYINAHTGRIFVVHIPGALTDEQLFGSVMEDIALMRIVGIKLVLVLGPRFQIERRLASEGFESHFVKGIRVTDDHTLQVVKEAAGSMLFEVEGKLARGVVNAPSLSRVSVVSGSFYIAQPLGVIDGDDFGYSGKVRRIDAEAVERRLNQGDIVILPNLGYSPTGQLFNCQSEEVAGACASALGAEKLIFMGNGESIYDKRIRKSIPNLTLSSAARFLELRAQDLPAQFRLSLQVSVRSLEKGVTRAHLLNRRVNGVLLMEVFHRDGVGLMISRDLYEGIRLARPQDVAGIEEIIKPLEQEGILVKRGRAGIEKAIDQYIVVERDGMIISCLSLSIMADNPSWGELGCFAVHPDYRKLGKGDAMLGFCERFALKKGVSRLFILSTVTFQWFLERGFMEVPIEDLPSSRQARYNKCRKSKIYVKLLEGSRAIDEAEVLKSVRPVQLE
jgi:amino-acid N-acetyltransferase